MPDSRLAHYEILELLGRGGMGEVHRARDTKLGREVALKLLPEDLLHDAERLARFRREAQVLASLHHPNIASIFGLEEDQGRPFLVMELAEGVDLSQRIFQGSLPEDEVIDIARQIAAGLEEAHEKGIVHRDLKPANIKLGSDGKVKILDFGLARAYAGETSEEGDVLSSPTITAAMSRGVILGTAAYMSPEQARGKKVDRRADIWSFGVVLFEMLCGRRMFEGETVSDTLAAVLRADPDWSALPEGTSPGLKRLLERCLERDPMKRLRDVGEARIFLESGAVDSSILASSASFLAEGDSGILAAPKGPGWLPWIVAGLLAVAGVLVGWKVLGRPEPPQLLHTMLPAPRGGAFNLMSTRPGPAALSPDGTMVVYSARDDMGKIQLHLRRLDSADAVVLSGTDGAAYPFWSADSRYIGFNADEKLKKVAVGGGPPVTLCAASNMKGGTWNKDGVILFAEAHNTGISRVSATGGEAVAVTTLPDSGTVNSHRHPRFLPDGKHFLFLTRASGDAENMVMFASLDGGEPREITDSETAAEYSEGNLLTVREGILLATPFDPETGVLGEGGVPLVEDILVVSQGAACGVYSPGGNGMLVYQVSTGSTDRGLQWLSASGSAGSVGETGNLFRPRISPDGTRAVVEILDPEQDTNDLWLVDLETGLRTRFTFDAADEYNPLWSNDGTEIFFVRNENGRYRLLRQPVEGTGGEIEVFADSLDMGAASLTPDGKTLLIDRDSRDTGNDVWALPLDGSEPRLLVQNPQSDGGAEVSPDGRWFVCHEQVPGSWHVIVHPMDGGPRKFQVATDAVYPFWSPGGDFLYCVGFGGELYRIPVDGTGATFRSGSPVVVGRVASPSPGGRYVDIDPTQERFLHVGGEVSEDETGYLELVTDWRRGLAN